jgi:hypothetical protein
MSKYTVIILLVFLTLAGLAVVLWPGPELISTKKLRQQIPQMPMPQLPSAASDAPQRPGAGAVGTNAPTPISPPQ